VSSVRYKLGSYIPEDDILRSHRCGNLKSYMYIGTVRPLHLLPLADPCPFLSFKASSAADIRR
jgi:hypothetical protein